MFSEKQSIIVRDGSKLTFEYVPQKLVHRDDQMRKLRMIFRPVFEEGRSETAVLVGSVGTGKTASAKRFCADMMQYGIKSGVPVDYVIVNCRQHSTETGVLLQIVRHFDPGHPDRGFSGSEMMRAIRGKVESSGSRFVIVLDEADVLLKKNAVDMIYQLSRFSEERISVSSSVSMILISQESITDKLDEASLSTFKRANTIMFSKYTRDELRSIIRIRSDEALNPDSIRDDSIDLLADITSEWGDARLAIELLDKAARIAEEKPDGIITAEDVREAKAYTYNTYTESKLQGLDMNHRLTLLAIARSIKSNSYVSTGAAEKTYAIVCEEYDVKARKHTQFWTYLQGLEGIGLISTSVRGDSDGGRTTFISLQDIPSKVLAGKLADLIENSR